MTVRLGLKQGLKLLKNSKKHVGQSKSALKLGNGSDRLGSSKNNLTLDVDLYRDLLGDPPIPSRLKGEDLICAHFRKWCFEMSRAGKLKCIWFHVQNEYRGKANYQFGALQKAMGKIAGAPDYVFMWEGGCACLEFKDIKGRQSDKQKLFEEWCKTHNVRYHICKSVDQAKELLQKWGVLLD